MSDPVSAGLMQIRAADPSFDPNGFTEGAKMAFEMILNSFSSNDRKTLKNLLSPDVFKNFDDAPVKSLRTHWSAFAPPKSSRH